MDQVVEGGVLTGEKIKFKTKENLEVEHFKNSHSIVKRRHSGLPGKISAWFKRQNFYTLKMFIKYFVKINVLLMVSCHSDCLCFRYVARLCPFYWIF